MLLLSLVLGLHACQKEAPMSFGDQAPERISPPTADSHSFFQAAALSFGTSSTCSYQQPPSDLLLSAQAQLALDDQEHPGMLDLLQERYGQPDWGSFLEEDDSLVQGEEHLSVVPILVEDQDSVRSLMIIYQTPGQVTKTLFFRRDGVGALLRSASPSSEDFEATIALDSLFLLYDDWLDCGGDELQDRCGQPAGCRPSWIRRLWLRIKRGIRKAFNPFYDVNDPGSGGGPTFVHGIFNVGGSGGSNSNDGGSTGGSSGPSDVSVCVPSTTLDVMALGEMIDALMGYMEDNGLSSNQLGLLLDNVNPICLNEQLGAGFATCVENSLRCALVDGESPCTALLGMNLTSEEVLWLLEHPAERREAESTLCDLARDGHHVIVIDREDGDSDGSVEIGILPYSCRSFDLTEVAPNTFKTTITWWEPPFSEISLIPWGYKTYRFRISMDIQVTALPGELECEVKNTLANVFNEVVKEIIRYVGYSRIYKLPNAKQEIEEHLEADLTYALKQNFPLSAPHEGATVPAVVELAGQPLITAIPGQEDNCCD
ncbi:MAG: hypothetical protein AAGG75_25635 [Bacteroidota bacterium]